MITITHTKTTKGGTVGNATKMIVDILVRHTLIWNFPGWNFSLFIPSKLACLLKHKFFSYSLPSIAVSEIIFNKYELDIWKQILLYLLPGHFVVIGKNITPETLLALIHGVTLCSSNRELYLMKIIF